MRRETAQQRVDVRYEWIVLGPSSLRCYRCHGTAHVPRWSAATFSSTVSAFFERHKHCAEQEQKTLPVEVGGFLASAATS